MEAFSTNSSGAMQIFKKKNRSRVSGKLFTGQTGERKDPDKWFPKSASPGPKSDLK